MWKSECTGDYGLSDCLLVTDEAWDYAESWFTRSTPARTPMNPLTLTRTIYRSNPQVTT